MSDHEVRSLFDVCEQVAVPLPEALGGPARAEIRSMFTVERERAEYEARIAALEAARAKATEDAGLISQRVAGEVARYADAVDRLQEAAAELAWPLAEESVALGLEVARAIIGRELEYDRGILVSSVDQALRRVRKDDDVAIRVGPADAAALREARPELFESGRAMLVEDAELPVGGCLVETDNRILDASIDSRLESARAALVEAVREARAAGEMIGATEDSDALAEGSADDADGPDDGPDDGSDVADAGLADAGAAGDADPKASEESEGE